MAQRISDIQQTIRTRHAQLVSQIIAVYIARNGPANLIQPIDAGFKPSKRLLQRLLERAAHGHHFTNRLHLCRQAIAGAWELLKCEARNLGDNIVDGRLERRWRCTARYIVLQFIEGVTNRQLGRNLGDRKPGRFLRQSRRSRNTWIHLDNQDTTRIGANGELHI